ERVGAGGARLVGRRLGADAPALAHDDVAVGASYTVMAVSHGSVLVVGVDVRVLPTLVGERGGPTGEPLDDAGEPVAGDVDGVLALALDALDGLPDGAVEDVLASPERDGLVAR